MSTQLYRITTPGAQHVRFEWPDGTPVKGPHYTYEGGKHLPIKRNGGVAQKVTYGAPRRDRNTDLSVSDFRSEIRLTPEGAKALAHMGLVPIVGSSNGKPAPLIDTSGENGSGPADGEPDPAVKVPSDWRDLSESRQRGIAAKISGSPKDDITATQAVIIIEAHLAAGGSHTG